MNKKMRFSLVTAAAGLILCGMSQAAVYDAEEILRSQSSGALAKVSAAQATRVVEDISRQMKRGDVLLLPREIRLGNVDLRALPDGSEVQYGEAEGFYLGTGTKRGLVFYDVGGLVHAMDPASALAKGSAVGKVGTILDSKFIMAEGFGEADHVNVEFIEMEIPKNHTAKLEGKKFENSKIFYLRYEQQQQSATVVPPAFILKPTGDQKGSMIYHIIAHNYCSRGSTMVFENLNNMYIGMGDTEKNRNEHGVMNFKNCKNTVVFGHRSDSQNRAGTGHCGAGGKSYVIEGGENMKFYAMTCTADPLPLSMGVTGSKSFQDWGGFYEDFVEVPDDALLMFTVANGMTKKPGSYSTPAQVENSTVLKYGNVKIMALDKNYSKPAATVQVPNPPSVRSLGLSGYPTPKVGSDFGKALLDAGADPTGQKSSTEAFKKMAGKLEIPAGTFLLTETLGGQQNLSAQGAGKGKTIIKVSGNFPAFQAGKNFIGITFDGEGKQEVAILNRYYRFGISPGGKVVDCEFKNQTKAGIVSILGVEFDQVRFYNNSFINSGDYGVLMENAMIDKQVYFNNHFKGQKKAGIKAMNTHMFAGAIVDNLFEDINGPGVDFRPESPTPAENAPAHQSLLMENTFKNCGSVERPSVDWGWNEGSAVIDNKILIDNKTVTNAFLGSGNILERDTVLVSGNGKLTGLAFGIRSSRQMRNGRMWANFITHCYSNNGGIGFVYDVLDGNAHKKDWGGYAFDADAIKWWQVDEPTELVPWAYPAMVYGSQFGENKFGYQLIRVSKTGNVLDMIPLNGNEAGVVKVASIPEPGKRAARNDYFDLRGRSIPASEIQGESRKAVTVERVRP